MFEVKSSIIEKSRNAQTFVFAGKFLTESLYRCYLEGLKTRSSGISKQSRGSGRFATAEQIVLTTDLDRRTVVGISRLQEVTRAAAPKILREVSLPVFRAPGAQRIESILRRRATNQKLSQITLGGRRLQSIYNENNGTQSSSTQL